jgi:type I restriction enzyme M protein
MLNRFLNKKPNYSLDFYFPTEHEPKIFSRIEHEQALVNANKQLIEIYGQRIKERIGKVWGE